MRVVSLFMLALASGHLQAEPAREGQRVFQANCARCHGAQADGDSAIARVVKPPPPDLRRTRLGPTQIREIVAQGGEGMGRSPIMPRWRGELNEDELKAVVNYVIGLKEGVGGVKSAARSQ
jgi:mono/diheme cytochrome c family protein